MPTFRCTECGSVMRADDVATHEHVPPPEPACSVCGVPESESQWGILIPVRVITNPGEEGYSEVEQLLCDDHAADVHEGLMKLGFVEHHHGSTNFLADETCPGAKHMDDCPTPTEYGPVTVPGGGWPKPE